MQHAGETGRQKFLRHALGQHRGQAERVFHIGQVIQFLAHGFFSDVAVQRDKGKHHIALAEFFVHLLLGLIYRSALGVRDRLVAVSKVRHALRNIAGHDDHEHECDHRPPQLVGKGAERPPVLGNERAVLGFGNHVLKPQDERRHEQQHGDQAEENTLGEHKAHIRPNAEPHERQREETDNGRRARSADRGKGRAQRIRHGLLGLDAVGLFLGERMQQEDRVVHRTGELQHRADRVGQKRNFAEDDIAAHVEHNCNAKHGQEQHGLEPRGCGERQDEENDNDREHHHACDLGIDGRPEAGVRHGRAGQQPTVADDLLDLVHCRVGAVGRVFFHKDYVHIGAVIFVIILDIVIIDERARAIDVGCGVAPHHHVHAVNVRDAVLDGFGLVQGHILQHHTAHAGIGKLLLHNIERLRGRGGIRQVFGQIVVDADHRGEQQAEHKQHREHLFNPLAVVDDQVNRTVSFQFHKEKHQLS